jgi:hypothetical protein
MMLVQVILHAVQLVVQDVVILSVMSDLMAVHWQTMLHL